jgi:hypothetical protein
MAEENNFDPSDTYFFTWLLFWKIVANRFRLKIRNVSELPICPVRSGIQPGYSRGSLLAVSGCCNSSGANDISTDQVIFQLFHFICTDNNRCYSRLVQKSIFPAF